MYPDPGDCSKDIDFPGGDGAKMWSAANSNDTLSCFKSIMENPHFLDGNGPLPYDTILSLYYGMGNPNFACTIDPRTPAGECAAPTSCESLMPLLLMGPSNKTLKLGYACDP
jgi:hypothetical protein